MHGWDICDILCHFLCKFYFNLLVKFSFCHRRVVIIIFTSIYFGSVLSFLNLCGIALAVIGVLLFQMNKREEAGDEKGAV